MAVNLKAFLEEFCRIKGIAHHFAPAYKPQNNSMAKRANWAILDKAQCLLLQANLSPFFLGRSYSYRYQFV
jgi:hypothetical protein